MVRSVIQLTVYQLFFFADVWKQLLECFFVLYEALKRDRHGKKLRLGNENSPKLQPMPRGRR